MQVKTIAVGSTNPVKIGAVKDALARLFPKAEFIGVETDSGVRAQPMTDEETLKGAKNRARRALEQTQAEIGVGLEGGVYEVKDGMMNTVWCCLLTKQGMEVLSGGIRFPLPSVYVKKIRQGREVAEVLDELEQEKNLRQKEGMIGVLTGHLTSRQEAYAQLVKLATVKLQSPKLYAAD